MEKKFGFDEHSLVESGTLSRKMSDFAAAKPSHRSGPKNPSAS